MSRGDNVQNGDATYKPPLQFQFQDFIDEVEAISELAQDFIAPEATHVLYGLKVQLENGRNGAEGREFDLAIPEDQPLRTALSEGEYEPDGSGTHQVRAHIASKWTIAPLGQPRRREARRRTLEVIGKASTKVSIIDELTGERLAMWRMELAVRDSPGCFFHIQVLGEHLDGPFPSTLSVPRFPVFLATPCAVLEYVLGEIFQKRWAQEMARGGNFSKQWRDIQAHRMIRLLQMQIDEVKRSSTSPWLALKSWQPDFDAFLRNT